MSETACDRLRVACVGDSLTRGDGLHEHPPTHRVPSPRMRLKNAKQFSIRQRGSYPALLARLLPEADVRNFGHGGATACAGGNPPYSSVREYRAALRFRPDVVVLMLGTNDAKRALWRGPCRDPSAGLTRGLTSIVDAFFNATRPPRLVLLLQPPTMLAPRVFGIERARLTEVRRTVAAIVAAQHKAGRHGVALAPPLPEAGLASDAFFTSDKLHLSANGSAVLACAAHDALRRAAVPSLRRMMRTALAATPKCTLPAARSCWDPFCADDAPSAVDDGHLRSCEADSGAHAPFLLTGFACSGALRAARAKCRAVRAHFGMRRVRDTEVGGRGG